ncbi:MAG: helix-turn-helix domain-containing protein [Bacteroidales bacterium]|nr:helix-turn-helix domain-containing protein [Clostridium sp.]MCM1203639.1 helix-turn-helix domain-containing protein [Bacteroidales bacterium]
MQRFENKYDLLNAAYKDAELKKGAIALLQYLVHKSNKEQCFPAVETIAKSLGVCKRTVQYNMRKLEKAGYITRVDRWYNHQQLSNQYVFNFGITEEKARQIRFTDAEYEKINGLSFNIPEKHVRKISEIQKIYAMKGLTARERMVLVYLYHRADKKGMLYDTPEVFMRAVGIRKRVFMQILDALRRKGMLRIKLLVIRKKEYLVMQLTGNTAAEEKRTVSDEREGLSMTPVPGNNFDETQPVIREKDTGSRKHFIKKFVQNVKDWKEGWKMKIYKILHLCRRKIAFSWGKLRKILRL